MLKAVLSAVFAAAALAGMAPQNGAHKKPKPSAEKPGASGAKRSEAAAAKVKQIDEVGLKALLTPGEARPRPLLVNFWATWCGPCREEFPDLVKIRADYAADKLDFVLVSLDDPLDLEKAVPEFLAEARATALPSYLLSASDDSNAINFVDPAWYGELPATFLYDRAGAVVFKHKGRIKPEELRAALDAALADRPAAPPATAPTPRR